MPLTGKAYARAIADKLPHRPTAPVQQATPPEKENEIDGSEIPF